MNGALSHTHKPEINEQEYPPDKITHYVFGQCIGRGSFGSVYYCLHRETRNEFASKVMSKRYLSKKFFIRELNTQGSTASDDEDCALEGNKNTLPPRNNPSNDTILSYLDLAYQEIDVMKTFRHPCLLRLYEVIQSTEMDKLLMILDLAEGPISTVSPQPVHISPGVHDMLCSLYNANDLNSLLEYASLCCTPMSLPFLHKAILHITLGLYALHVKDYVHADIKAANVLRLANGNFVLGDFSLTNHVSVTRTMSAVVSMAYASPDNRGLTKENDVWAFGVTLFMLLFGRHPASLCLHILVSKLPPPNKGIPLIIPSTPRRLHHWSDVLRDAPDALANILNVNTASPHVAIIKIVVGCLQLDYKKRFTIPQIYDLIITEYIKNTCYRVMNKLTLQLMLNFYQIQANIVLEEGLPSHVTDQYATSRFKTDIWNDAFHRREFYAAIDKLNPDLSLPLTQLVVKKNYAHFISGIVSNLDPSNEHAANFIINLNSMGIDGDIDMYFYYKFIRLFLFGVSTRRSFDMYWSDMAYLIYNNMNYKRMHTSRTLQELNLYSISSDNSDNSEHYETLMLQNGENRELAPELCNLDLDVSPLFEFEQRNHYFVKNMMWNFAFNPNFARMRIVLMKRGLRPAQLVFYELCMLRADLSRSLANGEGSRSKQKEDTNTSGRITSDYASMVRNMLTTGDAGMMTPKGSNAYYNTMTPSGIRDAETMQFAEEDAYGTKGYDGGNLFSSTLGVLEQDGKSPYSVHSPLHGELTRDSSDVTELFNANMAHNAGEDPFEPIDVEKLSGLFTKQYISDQEINGTGLYAENFSFGSGNKVNKTKVCVVADNKGDKASPSKAGTPLMKDLFNLDSKKDQSSMLGLGSFSLTTQAIKKTPQTKKKGTAASSPLGKGSSTPNTSRSNVKEKPLDDSSSSDSDIVFIEASNSDDMDNAFGLKENVSSKKAVCNDDSSDLDDSSDDSDIEFVASGSDNMDEAFGLNSSSSESEVCDIMDIDCSTSSEGDSDNSEESDSDSDDDYYSSDEDIVFVGSASDNMDVAFGLEDDASKQKGKGGTSKKSAPTLNASSKANAEPSTEPVAKAPVAKTSIEAITTPESMLGSKKTTKSRGEIRRSIAQSFDEFDETLEDTYMQNIPDSERVLYSFTANSTLHPIIEFATGLYEAGEDGDQIAQVQPNEDTLPNFSFCSFSATTDTNVNLFYKHTMTDNPDQDPFDVIDTIGEDSGLGIDASVPAERRTKSSLPSSIHGGSRGTGTGTPQVLEEQINNETLEWNDSSSNFSNNKVGMDMELYDEESRDVSQSVKLFTVRSNPQSDGDHDKEHSHKSGDGEVGDKADDNVVAVKDEDTADGKSSSTNSGSDSGDSCRLDFNNSSSDFKTHESGNKNTSGKNSDVNNNSDSSKAFELSINGESSEDELINCSKSLPAGDEDQSLKNLKDFDYQDPVHLSFHNDSIECMPDFAKKNLFSDLGNGKIATGQLDSNSDEYDLFIESEEQAHNMRSHASDAKINMYLKESEFHIPEEHMALLLTRTVVLFIYSTWTLMKMFNHHYIQSVQLSEAYAKFQALISKTLEDGTALYNKCMEYKDRDGNMPVDDEALKQHIKSLLKYGTSKSKPYAQATSLSKELLCTGEAYIRELHNVLGSPFPLDDNIHLMVPFKQDQSKEDVLNINAFIRFTPDNYKAYMLNRLSNSLRSNSMSQLTDASILDVQNSSFSNSMDMHENFGSMGDFGRLSMDTYLNKPNIMAAVPAMGISRSQLMPVPLPKHDGGISASQRLAVTLPPQDDSLNLLASIVPKSAKVDDKVPHRMYASCGDINNRGKKCKVGDLEKAEDLSQKSHSKHYGPLDLIQNVSESNDFFISPDMQVRQNARISPDLEPLNRTRRKSLCRSANSTRNRIIHEYNSADTFATITRFVPPNVRSARAYSTSFNARTTNIHNGSFTGGAVLLTNALHIIRPSQTEKRQRITSPRYGDKLLNVKHKPNLKTHQKNRHGIKSGMYFLSPSSISTKSEIDKEFSVPKDEDGLFDLSVQSSSPESDGNSADLITPADDLINTFKVSSGYDRASPHIKSAVTSMEFSECSKANAPTPLQDGLASGNQSFIDTVTTLTLADKQKRMEDLLAQSIHPFLVSSWKWTKYRLHLNASGLHPNKGWVVLNVVDVAHHLRSMARLINFRSTTASYGTDAPQVRLYCNENIIYEPRSLQNSITRSRLPKTIRETVEIRQNIHDIWVNIGLDAAERSPLVGIRHSTQERQGYIIRRNTNPDDEHAHTASYEGELSITRAQICTRKADGKTALKLKPLFNALESKNEGALHLETNVTTMNVGGKEIYGSDRNTDGKQDDQSSSETRCAIPSGYKVLNTCSFAPGGADKRVSIHCFSRNIPTNDYFTFMYSSSDSQGTSSSVDNLVLGDQNYLANWLIETDKIERPHAQIDEVVLTAQDTFSALVDSTDSQPVMPSILSAAAAGIPAQTKVLPPVNSVGHSVLRRKSISAANLCALYPTSTIKATDVSSAAAKEPFISPSCKFADTLDTMETAESVDAGDSARLEDYCFACENDGNSMDDLKNFQIEPMHSGTDASSERHTDLNDLESYDFQITMPDTESKLEIDTSIYGNVSHTLSQPSLFAPTDKESIMLNTPSVKQLLEPALSRHKTDFPSITAEDYDALEGAQRLNSDINLTDTTQNSTLQSLCIESGVFVNRMSFEEHLFMPHIFLEIFMDLLVNARQYSKPSIVRAALFNCQESLYLIVNDCGIGLPKQCWQHAFFHQQDIVDISQCLGTGLARAILITRAYGGIVNVSSCKNGGTRLILRIPLPKETTYVDTN